MKQFIIDIYNNNQDDYKYTDNSTEKDCYIETPKSKIYKVPLYEFLLCRDWLFAKAFSKYIYFSGKVWILDGGHSELQENHTYTAVEYILEDMLLQEMVIQKDILKSLEAYK